MDKKLLIQMGKELIKKVIDYIKIELLDKFKEAIFKALEAFKETLWENIKDEVHTCIDDILDEAKDFFKSEEWEKQEEFILDEIMCEINLPFVLKPFKSLIRKIIKSKLDKIINKTISN